MDEKISKDKGSGESHSFIEPVPDASVSYEELLKTKRVFEEMQRIAQFGTWDWDIKNDKYALSDGACHIYGLDPKANILDYESAIGLIHPEDRETARAALRAALDERKPYSVNYRVVRPDGNIRHVHEYGSAVCDNGVPVRAFGSIKDNTVNMEMHDKLKESELLYRTLFENSVDAFLIVELIYDKNGSVCDFRNIKTNEKFEEHTGLNPSCALGRLASEAKPYIESYWIEMFDSVAKAGKPMHYQNYHKYTNRWYDVYCFPYIKDQVGAVFRDITQYKAAEEALREANENNAQILDSINDGYGMFGRDGTVIKVGSKFTKKLGKTPEECVGMNLDDYLPEKRYEGLCSKRKELIAKVFETEKVVEFQDTRDGLWFNHRCYPVFKDGIVNAVSIISTDITDAKKAEEEERKNEQLRLEAEMLKEKEREYLELLDGSNEGMRIIDFKEKRVEFSPKWAQHLGIDRFTPEELFLSQAMLIHADDLERVKRERLEAEKSRLPAFTQEYRIRAAGSDYIWILDRGKIIYGGNGKPVKAYASSMDITARKCAEEALRERESRLKAVLECLPSAVLITDPAGQTAESNRALREVWGEDAPLAAPELYKEYRGWLPGTGKRIKADEWPLARSVRGETVRNAVFEIESFDGKRKLIRADSSPITGPHGENYGAVAINEDITEVKRAGDALNKALLREQVLGEITSRLLEIEDTQAVMEDIFKTSAGYVEFDVFFNYMCEDGRLHLNACSGIASGEAEKLEWLRLGEAVCGCAARDGKRIIVTDVQSSDDPKAQPLKSFGLQCYVSFPLKSDDHVIGTISFGSRKRSAFTEDELLFLGSISEHVAIAMNRLIISKALREREEQHAFNLKLSDALRQLSDAKAIRDSATCLLTEHLQASQTSYSEITEDSIVITSEKSTDETMSLAGVYDLKDYSGGMDALRTGKALVIPDMLYFSGSSEAERARMIERGIRATVSMPLIKEGRLVATLTVRHSTPREWTQGEVELVRETAERTWAAVERVKAEEALRESEEKYREVVEHSPAGIYEIDFRTGRFTSVNDAMCFITGYSREEFLSMTPFELLDEENAAKFRQRMKQWMSGEEIERTVDYKLKKKDGREIYALLSVKIIKDGKGSPVGASAIAHDITERKKAEEEINRQNLILQTINKVYEASVSCATQRELGNACLVIIRSIIGNNAGFIGDVGRDGTLHNIALSLGTEISGIPETMANHRRMDGRGVVGLYMNVIESAASILTNEPMSHPGGTEIPEGHFKMRSFLGVPFVQGGTVIGLIGLANKQGGFSEKDRQILEAITPSILEVLLRKSTEEALRESESKYEMLVKYAPAGIYEMDFRTRRFISVNDALCRMSGYTREEMLEIDPAVFMDERSKALFLARVEQWMRGKEPKRNVDYKVKARDGRELFISLDVSFKKGEDGKLQGVTGIVHDITQRKIDEAVINRKNRILQVINNIHERSVSCRTMDELESACLEAVNAVTNSGVSFIGELKGEKLVYEVSLASVGGGGLENTNRRLGRLNGEGLFRSVIENKTSLLASYGPSCPGSTGVPGSDTEIYSFLGVPFIRNGNVAGLIAAANRAGGYTEDEKETLEALAPAIYEVLMRKRAEEALKESEERLADEFNAVMRIQKISANYVQEGDFESILYNILKAAIMISGAYKGTLQLLRPGTERLEIAAQLGFDQSYIDFLSLMSRGSTSVCVKALELEKRVIVEDITKSSLFANASEMDIQLAAGVRAVQYTPFINSRGKVIGILATHWDRPCDPSDNILRYIDLLAGQASDIIERKWAEEELRESEECARALVKKLEEADRNKNGFLSSLSHEIRNPLATISAGLQLMDVSSDVRQIKNAKEIINRQMDQLCSLVDELLDLTRISNNKIELKKQRIELGGLVSLVAKDHAPLAGNKGLKLETRLSKDIYVDADPVRITQIIGNLLHNAFKFTAAGAVTLSVYEENGQAVICVKDPGIGINPENLSRIFEPFMQLGGHIDRKDGGLGLGLSIVRAISQLHGGEAGVYSEGEGKGSEFYIRLPAIRNEAAQQEENETDPATQKRFKVLAIEDNRDYSEMMCELLRFLGHDVASAPDGLEGIKKAKENTPDIIICDIGLPGISGYETARRIRNDENLKKVFLVSLTGYTGPQYAQDSQEAGFDLHITKPADIDALRRILNEAGKRCS